MPEVDSYKVSTKQLVEELRTREGVDTFTSPPYEPYRFSREWTTHPQDWHDVWFDLGPAIFLRVID